MEDVYTALIPSLTTGPKCGINFFPDYFFSLQVCVDHFPFPMGISFIAILTAYNYFLLCGCMCFLLNRLKAKSTGFLHLFPVVALHINIKINIINILSFICMHNESTKLLIFYVPHNLLHPFAFIKCQSQWHRVWQNIVSRWYQLLWLSPDYNSHTFQTFIIIFVYFLTFQGLWVFEIFFILYWSSRRWKYRTGFMAFTWHIVYSVSISSTGSGTPCTETKVSSK